MPGGGNKRSHRRRAGGHHRRGAYPAAAFRRVIMRLAAVVMMVLLAGQGNAVIVILAVMSVGVPLLNSRDVIHIAVCGGVPLDNALPGDHGHKHGYRQADKAVSMAHQLANPKHFRPSFRMAARLYYNTKHPFIAEIRCLYEHNYVSWRWNSTGAVFGKPSLSREAKTRSSWPGGHFLETSRRFPISKLMGSQEN